MTTVFWKSLSIRFLMHGTKTLDLHSKNLIQMEIVCLWLWWNNQYSGKKMSLYNDTNQYWKHLWKTWNNSFSMQGTGLVILQSSSIVQVEYFPAWSTSKNVKPVFLQKSQFQHQKIFKTNCLFWHALHRTVCYSWDISEKKLFFLALWKLV